MNVLDKLHFKTALFKLFARQNREREPALKIIANRIGLKNKIKIKAVLKEF